MLRPPFFNAYLQLNERETTTGAHAAVVLDGRASDNRAELVDWARSQLGGLVLAGIASAGLTTGLFEESGVRTLLCTAGATALKVRGELPGRSARGHGVASPCGNLRHVSGSSSMRRINVLRVRGLRLCWICWLCLIVWLECQHVMCRPAECLRCIPFWRYCDLSVT